VTSAAGRDPLLALVLPPPPEDPPGEALAVMAATGLVVTRRRRLSSDGGDDVWLAMAWRCGVAKLGGEPDFGSGGAGAPGSMNSLVGFGPAAYSPTLRR
jgi:hypothetical protein